MSGGETYSLLIFMKRRPGMDRAAFREHYETSHVPLAMKYMRGPVRYRRTYLEPVDGMAEPEFDVVTELGFPTPEMRDRVIAAMKADAMPADVVADEELFLDRSKTRFHAVTEAETELEPQDT